MRWFLVVLTLLLTLPTAPPAMAESAELMKSFNQYKALNKAGKYREAETHAKRALSLGKKELGPKHKTYASLLNNLAELYRMQGRYIEAEPPYRRSLKIRKKALGPDHPDVAASLNNLAELYRTQGRYGEAEPLHKRSLKIKEKALGPDHPDVGTSLNNLAGLYRAQKRYIEAEPLYRRDLKITQKALGADHPTVGDSLNNLAGLYEAQKRYSKAEPLYRRSLNIYEKALGPSHPLLAITLNNLAGLYFAQSDWRQAEPLYRRSLNIYEKVLGPDHPLLATTLNNLAQIYFVQSDWRQAETLLMRSLRIDKKALGRDHPKVSTTLNNLALLYFAQSNWRQAAANWREATNVLTLRAERDGKIGRRMTGSKKSEVAQNSWYFTALVKSIYRDERQAGQTDEPFLSAQWAIGSQAAGALAQMSARKAAGSGELADLVRERQDSVRRWQTSEKRMNTLRGAGKSDLKLEAQMTKIDKRIAAIDKRLAKEFPDYAALASPKPLSIKQVQKLLGPDEALVLLLDTPKAKPTPAETFIWAVTRERFVLKRADLGGKVLSDKIALLRKELDPSSATRAAPPSKSAAVGQQKAKRGFAPTMESAGFSLATAHELYTKLLGPVENVISDKKHLMIVGSGPLTALPFQVLIKTKPQGLGDEKYQKADWLIRHHAITTLPSVSSLQALRGIAKTAKRAPEPLIGFADPVFARGKAKPVKVASADQANRGYASFFRGRSVDLASLSGLAALPGTRRELNGIGKILKVADKHLHYGRDASEGAVKKAALDKYRIVYFATHGLVSGDVEGLGEPALAFSLPAKATPEDDGLLTASEVTQLKLNADWLVMSACNTASGDKPGAEALSGLARAFFYAGAKTLLVSHWPVGDEAAVALTTHAFKSMQRNPKLGKSQALRRSMLAMISKGGEEAHPTTWAPFVVVGEGATR